MLALEITSLKLFMNQLLTGATFDSFLLEEATISTANTVRIDGLINKDFYPAEERDANHLPYDFQPWSEIKGLCFHLIKGKRTPLFFKFVFHLKPEKASTLLIKENSSVEPSAIRALVLNIRFDGAKAILTSGIAYHTFLMNKEAEIIWDKALKQFLSDKGIAYEEL